MVGLSFGLLIGAVSGLLTFVPYVGSLTALVVSTAVACAEFFPDWKRIRLVVGVVLFGQFLEGNVLSPKLVGQSAGLHPVWLIFALLAFGSFVRFCRSSPRRTRCSGGRRVDTICRVALPGEPALYREPTVQRAMNSRPRQLALVLDHAESYAREDFFRRALQ